MISKRMGRIEKEIKLEEKSGEKYENEDGKSTRKGGIKREKRMKKKIEEKKNG